jgi:acyl-CoA synthetase (AMP-forming)/AMP-acid ligase II
VLVADATSAAVAQSLADIVGAVLVTGPDGSPWDAEPAAAPPLAPAADTDECMLFFTSGSTGRPKLAGHAYGAVRQAIPAFALPGFAPGAVALIVPPAFHVAGAVWIQLTLASGAAMVFPADGASLLGTMSHHGVTHALMVPTLIRMLLDEQAATGIPVPRLQLIAYGTSPITGPLLRAAMDALGCEFVQCYGTTEAGGVITMLDAADHQPADYQPADYQAGRMTSAGRPLAGITVQAFRPGTAQPCPPGEPGELRALTPMAMSGYLGDPAASAAALDAAGWLRTRDLGYLDADGYVYVLGRLDDVIITGGENVHPAEVEEALSSLPGLAAACVTGMPDERWGQRVAAAVVRADPGLSEAAVREHCRARLAHYKCPSQVVFVADLPRNATGKVIRSQVRDQVAAIRPGPA